jgi:hypothetical protein
MPKRVGVARHRVRRSALLGVGADRSRRLTDVAENVALTEASAVASALAAGEDVAVRSYGFETVAIPVKSQLIQLRLIRIGVEPRREWSVEVSRSMTPRLFSDACRRAWTFLKLEHERTKKPGEY